MDVLFSKIQLLRLPGFGSPEIKWDVRQNRPYYVIGTPFATRFGFHPHHLEWTIVWASVSIDH
jgi:hypothetical protein